MKHIKQRIAALAMACALVLTLSPAAFAANFADMPAEGTPAAEALQAAVDNGLLQGSDGLLRPDDAVTRAEMATIIVRAFGTTQTKDVSGFVDVDANAWYVTGGFLPSAYFMQVMNDDGEHMNPNADITREEAFAVLARALKLDEGSADTLEQFKDGSSVSSDVAGLVAAMVEAGYVSGNDGSINPQGSISRADFAVLMHSIFGAYISEEGDYTELADGSIMISEPGVTIHDTTIHGDVIIGEGVGEGDVIFQNVTIEGRVVVRGGGANSIHFINSETLKVVVSKILGLVRVVADSASTVPEVSVVAGSDTVTVEGTVAAVTVDSATPVEVKDATVETVTVNAADAAVTITGESSVEAVSVTAAADVTITGAAEVATVEAAAGTVTATGNATVETITTTGADVTVAETATVATVEVPETAENVTVSVADTATVDTVKAETDITLDGADNVGAVEAPEDVTVGDSEGNQVDTAEPSAPVEDVPVIIPPAPPVVDDSENEGGNTGGDGNTNPIPDAAEDPSTQTPPATSTTDGDGSCTTTDNEGNTVTTHTWGEPVVTAGDCENFGTSVKTCSICGAKETTYTAKASHTPNTDPDETVNPTCEDDGYKSYSCSVCGTENVKVETLTATGHSAAPTAGDSAWTITATTHSYTCSVCGETVSDGHDADGDDESCSVCGYKADATVPGVTEENCPDKNSHAALHVGKTCSTCGYAGTVAHTFENGADCECGATGTPHNWVSGECTADGHKNCTCDHSDDADTTDTECSVCGATVAAKTKACGCDVSCDCDPETCDSNCECSG